MRPPADPLTDLALGPASKGRPQRRWSSPRFPLTLNKRRGFAQIDPPFSQVRESPQHPQGDETSTVSPGQR